MALNEYLERALVAYYRRQQHRYVGSFIACGVGLGVVIAWVLLAKPAEGWFSAPVALVGIPCAVGFVVLMLIILVGHRRTLLEWLREGLHVRKVKRGTTVVSKRPDRPQLLEVRVPTIFVEMSDGRAYKLLSLGDAEQLSRLDLLLRKQMEQQHQA
jgi:hypothetical protein